ncbi:MAG: exo-alpha-sialidase, partial [Ignavibacteriae bacterium]|nr:exo-alpha-sialidase [Ignavibacteriota bacterium]
MRRILLFLSLIILLSNYSIFSQFDIIQKFPLQDSTATHGSSAIIPLTDNKQLFFWTENNKLFLANVEGSNYYNKRVVIENVLSEYYYKNLTVLKTNTNRIIIVFTYNSDTLSNIKSIYSDDEGLSWSKPKIISTNTERLNYMNPCLSQTHDGIIWLIFNKSRSLYSANSNDNGTNWNIGSLIENNYSAGSIISDNSNKYYLFYTKAIY